jgi:hypothetical protein
MNTKPDDSSKVVRLRSSSKKRKRTLTPKQRRDHLLLKTTWEYEISQGRKLSLRGLADKWGLVESAPGPYLRGDLPLSAEWKMRFAIYLDCKPEEIWPDWEYRALTDGDFPPSVIPLCALWKSLSRAMRADVLRYIEETYGKLVAGTAEVIPQIVK